MATYSIRPIALCAGPRDASQYTYLMNMGTSTTSVCYIWYIEGSKPKTLVDAGFNSTLSPGFGLDLSTPEAGLSKIGLKPEDIEVVIVTHLHRDHIALARLFCKARFIVQKKEFEYARNPHPIDAAVYDRTLFEDLAFEFVDGEQEIIPGVSVFLSPGHTVGGQSIEVNTSAGRAIITGFCSQLSTFEQTEAMKKKGWQVGIPLLHHDVKAAYDSVLTVKKRADILVPLHDAFLGAK